jgi:hypothetical protein
MKILTSALLITSLLTLVSCGQSTAQKSAEEKHKSDSIAARQKRIETSLAMQDSFNKERGQTGNSGWFCPDNSKGFPPVDITSWDKVPVVNGRLPEFEETENGTSLIYYDAKKTPDAKPYALKLPKLATFYCPFTEKEETVIVIQIVQTSRDTVAGYRFLTGGNGTADFRDFHFLTDNEIKKAVNQSR